MREFINKELSTFFNGHFPREIAYIRNSEILGREIVDDLDSFMNKMYDQLGYANVYTSNYSIPQQQAFIVDRLYYDFDSYDISIARRDALQFENYIIDMFGGQPLVLESGNKGYNVDLLFPPTDFTNLDIFRESVRGFTEAIVDELKLTTLDMSVVGDIRRLRRVPYSINVNGMKLCQPYYREGHNGAETPLIYRSMPELSKYFRETNAIYETKKVSIDIIAPEHELGVYQSDLDFYMKRTAMGRDGVKRAIFGLIAPLMAKSYPLEKAEMIMTDWLSQIGREELLNYALYQVRTAARKKIKPWNITTFVGKYPDLARFYQN